MSSRSRTTEARIALALAGALALGACNRTGASPTPGPASAPAEAVEPTAAVSDLRPGDPGPQPADARIATYEGVPEQIAAGKQYFTNYNCDGCHFSGGGGIGPALMDDNWIYGGRLDQIYRSIADGRPNGMPTWRGKIPDAQIWQISAYVKSLSSPQSLQANAASKTPLEPAGLSDPHLDARAVGQ